MELPQEIFSDVISTGQNQLGLTVILVTEWCCCHHYHSCGPCSSSYCHIHILVLTLSVSYNTHSHAVVIITVITLAMVVVMVVIQGRAQVTCGYKHECEGHRSNDTTHTIM